MSAAASSAGLRSGPAQCSGPARVHLYSAAEDEDSPGFVSSQTGSGGPAHIR